jgi:hypothetical protein
MHIHPRDSRRCLRLIQLAPLELALLDLQVAR